MKKKLITFGVITSIVAPAATVISCGTDPSSDKGYDIGFAVNPIGSLNYLKYKSSADAASPLVESLFKAAPTKSSAIANYLNLPDSMLLSLNESSKTPKGTYSGENNGFQTGTLKRKHFGQSAVRNKGVAAVTYLEDTHEHATKYAFNLNGESK